MKNNKGVTLIELIVAVLISSIILSMLIQMIVMSVQIRNNVQIESRMKDESYFLVEQIKWNAFKLQTQSVEMTETTSTITITFHHDKDVNIDPTTGAITWIDSTVSPETLVYYKDNGQEKAGQIHYEGVIMHPANIVFTLDTAFTITPINSDCVPSEETCSDVVLTLILDITIEIDDGTRIVSQKFETTIIL